MVADYAPLPVHAGSADEAAIMHATGGRLTFVQAVTGLCVWHIHRCPGLSHRHLHPGDSSISTTTDTGVMAPTSCRVHPQHFCFLAADAEGGDVKGADRALLGRAGAPLGRQIDAQIREEFVEEAQEQAEEDTGPGTTR